MSSQNQAQGTTYSSGGSVELPSYAGGNMVAPPPAGYPRKDGQQAVNSQDNSLTQSRGDGFWKGCCAALCCCCVLDACF